MKLKTKYPCEQCAEGTYMTVEQEWWCDKHLMYACQMKKNRLCEKFERDGEVVDTDDIKALPSVTPAPKKGKWIDTDVTLLNRQGCLVHEVICSECNGISYFRKMGNKYIGANFCPSCGAKMEAEKNE